MIPRHSQRQLKGKMENDRQHWRDGYRDYDCDYYYEYDYYDLNYDCDELHQRSPILISMRMNPVVHVYEAASHRQKQKQWQEVENVSVFEALMMMIVMIACVNDDYYFVNYDCYYCAYDGDYCDDGDCDEHRHDCVNDDYDYYADDLNARDVVCDD